MTIHRRIIREERINASYSDVEIKKILLEHTLKEAGITTSEYTHRTYLTSSLGSTGNEYHGKVEIQIDLAE